MLFLIKGSRSQKLHHFFFFLIRILKVTSTVYDSKRVESMKAYSEQASINHQINECSMVIQGTRPVLKKCPSLDFILLFLKKSLSYQNNYNNNNFFN